MFKLKLGASSASKCNVGARGVGDKRKVPTRETDSLSIKYKKSAKVQRVRNTFSLELRSGSKVPLAGERHYRPGWTGSRSDTWQKITGCAYKTLMRG